MDTVSILKFGGTSVGSGVRIRHVASIIAGTLGGNEQHFPVVVVSAMAGITDQLLSIARSACTGDQEVCRRELAGLKERHFEAADQAVQGSQAHQVLLHDLQVSFEVLEREIASAEALRSAARYGHPDPSFAWARRVAPGISAWGERLSVLLVAAATHDLGVQAAPVREEVIITGEPRDEMQYSLGTVTGADPLTQETRTNAQRLIVPLVQRGIVPITPGFIGRTPGGAVTTLGRNGSDYSAAVVGEALDCAEVTIFTDVDGFLSADPRIVVNARLLPRLSYAEAARLSRFGAKVLHPRALTPVARRNIPVRVRNTFRPLAAGTVVGPEPLAYSGAVAITVRSQLALITLEHGDLFAAAEYAGRAFGLAARADTAPVAICSSSALSFVIEEQVVDDVVALLQHDGGNWHVSTRRGLAACACIGSGFTADSTSAARARAALVSARIPVITQGTSDTGMILIVADGDSERAVRCLHGGLIAPPVCPEPERGPEALVRSSSQ
jgi:aspartate kinase